MKKIEKVLLAIRMECDKQTKLTEVSCFDKIADKAELPRQSLSLYLSELQERGYIKYSVNEKFVYITKEGTEHIS